MQVLILCGQETLDVACSLTDAMFVLDQCDTNIFITMFTKAYTRSDGHIGHFNQQL
ncbi:hypothetical protein D3C71_2225920 [compost metagenome]